MPAIPEKIIVLAEPLRVELRLRELAPTLSGDALREAMHSGLMSWAATTENDPPSYPGTSLGAGTVRGLRDQLLPQNWKKSDSANYSTVTSPDGDVTIVVATGDEATGILHRTPTTKCPKGPETEAIVTANKAQLELFATTETPKAKQVARVTYMLLVVRAKDGMRGELSLPEEIGEDGKIEQWRERLILAALGGDDSGSVMRVPEPGPELDVDVTRRAAS